MAGIVNTLYPPVLDTYMPSFIRNKNEKNGCRVYFTLSDYNSAESIKQVQISVRNQYTNESVLTDPTGILLAYPSFDEEEKKYYVIIPDNAIANTGFETDQYYKVQLRFSSEIYPGTNLTEDWLILNKDYFSEWSRVCLIKAIDRPKLQLRGFSNKTVSFTTSTVDLVGSLTFYNGERLTTSTSEFLQSYEVIIRIESGEEIYRSEIIHTNAFAPNQINYTIPYGFLEGIRYILTLNYITNNGYRGSEEYSFSIITSGINKMNAYIIAVPNYTDGAFDIYIDEDPMAIKEVDDSFFPHKNDGSCIIDSSIKGTITQIIHSINKDNVLDQVPDIDDRGQFNLVVYNLNNEKVAVSGSVTSDDWGNVVLGTDFDITSIEAADIAPEITSEAEVNLYQTMGTDQVRMPTSLSIDDDNDGNVVFSESVVIDGKDNNYVAEPKTNFALRISSLNNATNDTVVHGSISSNENGDVLISQGLYIREEEKEELAEKRYTGSYTIRRASSETNFTIWEDVYTNTVYNHHFNKEEDKWSDYTIESGIWYKYAVQKRDIHGNRGLVTIIEKPVMRVFDHMYLTNEDLQICIKHNPNVTNFKYNVADSKSDTIGSKYPFIRRNGNMKYRQFSITGLVNSFWDEEGTFLNKNNIYKYEDVKTLYDNIEKNVIPTGYDYTYEREFRERVMEFLYANTVKLFRSPTEGNILVRLMDISFTPNQTLGRLVYTFTATAHEIDEYNIKNCDFYNVQKIGTYSTKVGQVTDEKGFIRHNSRHTKDQRFIQLKPILKRKYQYATKDERFVKEIQYLTWLRIEFESEPYLIGIRKDNKQLKRVELNDGIEYDSYIHGYLIQLDEKQTILVGPKGYYELIHPDTKIYNVGFMPGDDVSVTYIAHFFEYEDPLRSADTIIYDTRIAQMRGAFNYNQSLMSKLIARYYRNKKNYYQKLLAVNELTIEAVPGTVVEIKDCYITNTNQEIKENEFHKHIINETGLIHFCDPDRLILDFKITGVILQAVGVDFDLSKRNLRSTECKYINPDMYYPNTDAIKNPIPNGIYNIGDHDSSVLKIYFKDLDWYDVSTDKTFEGAYIVHCSVEATIDFICELVRGEYHYANA